MNHPATEFLVDSDNGTNDNVSTYTSDNYSITDNTSNISYTLTQGGFTTLYIWVKDAAGNIAGTSSQIVLDNESPTGTRALSFAGSYLSSDESRTDNLTIQIDNNTLFVTEMGLCPSPLPDRQRLCSSN